MNIMHAYYFIEGSQLCELGKRILRIHADTHRGDVLIFEEPWSQQARERNPSPVIAGVLSTGD